MTAINWFTCKTCRGRFRNHQQIYKHLMVKHSMYGEAINMQIGRSTKGSLRSVAKTRRVTKSAEADLAAWRKKHIG